MLLAKVNGVSGEVKLQGSDAVIGNVKESGRLTLRICVDFASAKAFAFGEENEILDSVDLSVPQSQEGYEQTTTMLEWQKIAANYLLFAWMNNPLSNEEGSISYIGIDNIKITEGNVYG